jgi:ankyrin repeat protein
MNKLILSCALLIFVCGIEAEKSYKDLGEELLNAAAYKDLKAVKDVLARGADPLYLGGMSSRTALIISASKDDAKMVDYLLNIPAVKNSQLINLGTSNFDWGWDRKIYCNPELKAYSSKKCIDRRMTFGGVTPLEAAIIDEIYTPNGVSYFYLRSQEGLANKAFAPKAKIIKKFDRVGTVKRLLIEPKIDLTLGTRNILSAAIENGKYDNYEIVKLLIKKIEKDNKLGEIINYLKPNVLNENELPLIAAINYDAPIDIIELLLKNGAAPDARGKDKKSARDIVERKLQELKKVKLGKVDYIANKLGLNFGVPGQINRLEKIIKLFEMRKD